MPRHRGKFDVNRIEPYELSRSRIENFIKCPACFYMQQVEKIEFPSIPGFNINEATDLLLKKDALIVSNSSLDITNKILTEVDNKIKKID